jgi:hypothetical protein
MEKPRHFPAAFRCPVVYLDDRISFPGKRTGQVNSQVACSEEHNMFYRQHIFCRAKVKKKAE